MNANDPPPAMPSPRRRRRWLRWFIAAGVLSFGLLAFPLGLDYYREVRAWREACAEADRLDPGWRWDDLLAARPAVPDAENAALTVRAVAQLLPRRWPDWASVIRDEEVPPPPPTELPPEGDAPPDPPSAEERRKLYAVRFEANFNDLSPNQRLRPNHAAILRRMLAATAPALEAARPLPDQPRGRWAVVRRSPLLLDFSNDHMQDSRTVAHLLEFQSLLQAEDGPADAALSSARAILNVARPCAEEPRLFDCFAALSLRQTAAVRIERVLAQSEPSLDALAAAQRRAEEEYGHASLLLGLRGERAAVADTVRAWEKGQLPTEEIDQALWFNTTPKEVTGYEAIDRWLQYLRGGEWDRRLAAAYLRYLTRFIEYAKLPSDGLRPEELAVVQSLAPPALQKSELQKTLVSAEKEAVVACRTRAMLAAAAVALAAERFRRERDRWPESLGELVPGHLRSHPVDPFDGRPLRFRRLADGLVIYSVGENGTDDDGQVRFDPRAYEFLDVGIRLWDVAHRRQEPPPPAAGPN